MFKLQNLILKNVLSYSSLISSLNSQHQRFVHFMPNAKKGYGKSKYGGWHVATLIPGHGIGPELATHVQEAFSVAGVPVSFDRLEIDAFQETNKELDTVITSIKRNGVAIKGNIETKSLNSELISRNVYLRNELDLYISLLHCYSFPGVKSRHKDINIFVIRQNTEGEYSNMEHEVIPGVVDSLKLITRSNSERIAKYAFNFARSTGRKKVTTIHKANIMKLSDGLFLEVSREVAKDFPDIEHNDMIIDNCCMQLVSKPEQFDVMLMPNLYGAIVTNVIMGLIGGAGLISGCNYGDQYAVFESGSRGTGTNLVGKNIANPISMLNASVDLLRHLGLNSHSKLMQNAIHNTINVEKIHTRDLNGMHTTADVMKSITAYLKANKIQVLCKDEPNLTPCP